MEEVELTLALSMHIFDIKTNSSRSTLSLRYLVLITDSNNKTLQEHLDETNISHNDMKIVQLLNSQNNNNNNDDDVVLNENISNVPAVNEPVLHDSTRLRKPSSRLDL